MAEILPPAEGGASYSTGFATPPIPATPLLDFSCSYRPPTLASQVARSPAGPSTAPHGPSAPVTVTPPM